MDFIRLHKVAFTGRHPDRSMGGARALDGVSVGIPKGEFVTLFGGRGSGRSTFLKLCNALLLPTEGEVHVAGLDTRDRSQTWEIRRLVGMLFQDTDSQIIGSTVVEDVAFGPENLGLSPQVIQNRVADALQAVGLSEYAQSATHILTPAQKLHVSLAGVLAMKPECILLDEAAAALGPVDREAFMKLLHRFNRELGITVLQAVSSREESAGADRIIELEAGKIVYDAKPEQIPAVGLTAAGSDLKHTSGELARKTGEAVSRC